MYILSNSLPSGPPSIRLVHNLIQWYPIYQYNVLFSGIEVQWETFEILMLSFECI